MMLSYRLLAGLCNTRRGMNDVACPFCGSSRKSPVNRKRRVFRIWQEKPGFASYYCARCGERGWAREDGAEQDQAIAALRSCRLWGETGFRPLTHLTPRRAGGRDDAKRTEAALAIWRSATSADGTLVETYLVSRGLNLPPPTRLRFSALLRHPSGNFWPAMIALVTRGADDTPLAIHRTFLACDGVGKAPVDPQKMMLGPCRGGVVRLAAPTDVLMVGEARPPEALRAASPPCWQPAIQPGRRYLPRGCGPSISRRLFVI